MPATVETEERAPAQPAAVDRGASELEAVAAAGATAEAASARPSAEEANRTAREAWNEVERQHDVAEARAAQLGAAAVSPKLLWPRLKSTILISSFGTTQEMRS